MMSNRPPHVLEISVIPQLPSNNYLSDVTSMLTWFVWLAYELLITRFLRIFYFEGPIWHNLPPEEICSKMTGVDARHWTLSADNIIECQIQMERRFHSWDRTVMTVFYFSVLTLITLRLLILAWHWCFWKFSYSHSLSSSGCTSNSQCSHCNHNMDVSNSKLISKEELISIMREASSSPPKPHANVVENKKSTRC
jgi:hypothetical protein